MGLRLVEVLEEEVGAHRRLDPLDLLGGLWHLVRGRARGEGEGGGRGVRARGEGEGEG